MEVPNFSTVAASFSIHSSNVRVLLSPRFANIFVIFFFCSGIVLGIK